MHGSVRHVHSQSLTRVMKHRGSISGAIPLSLGGRGEGEVLGSNPVVCPKVKDIWVFFQPQGSEMSENISLKMGVKFAVSFNMGKNLC